MKVSDLNPNPQNPRKIDDDGLNRLLRTLKKYGDLSGIVYNQRTKQLVGGHQRTKVLPPDAKITLEKSYTPKTKVGTVSEGYVEFSGERFKFRVVDWDRDTEHAANIAANTGAGDWLYADLAGWMLDLDAKGWDIEDMGWSMKEFEDLCAPEIKEKKDKNEVICPKCDYKFKRGK